MKKRSTGRILLLTTVLLLLFAPHRLSAHRSAPQAVFQPDSASLRKLDTMLEEFYTVLADAPAEQKNAEMDRLIASCAKGELRNHIASKIFFHYKDSPIMGEESVALHVYDAWFAGAEASFPSEQEEFEASLFEGFNRLSMLYMDAPRIRLKTPCGLQRTFPGRKLEILYFYDTDCSKCKATGSLLPYALESYFETHPDSPASILRLNMIYTGSDAGAWKQYRKSFSVRGVKVRHAWDPEMDSDYQKKYGVTMTPRLFVITPQGMIIGRRLETDSLLEVLDYYYIYRQYE